MNIFYVDKSPVTAAQMMCDKHVPKMIVESAQMLSTAHRMLDGTKYTGKTKKGRNIKRWLHPNSNLEKTLYLACHTGHPSTLWVMESAYNYIWLYRHMMALHKEWQLRYGHSKNHLTIELLGDILKHTPMNIQLNKIATEPTPAMPDHCKVDGDSVASYRNYYILEKKRFAKWEFTKTPEWYIEGKIIDNEAEEQYI